MLVFSSKNSFLLELIVYTQGHNMFWCRYNLCLMPESVQQFFSFILESEKKQVKWNQTHVCLTKKLHLW